MGIGSLLNQMAQNPDDVEDAVFDATAPSDGSEMSDTAGPLDTAPVQPAAEAPSSAPTVVRVDKAADLSLDEQLSQINAAHEAKVDAIWGLSNRLQDAINVRREAMGGPDQREGDSEAGLTQEMDALVARRKAAITRLQEARVNDLRLARGQTEAPAQAAADAATPAAFLAAKAPVPAATTPASAAAPVATAPQAAPAASPVKAVPETAPVAKPVLSAIHDTADDADEDLTNTDGGDGLVACGDAEVPAQLPKDKPKTTPVFPGDKFACGFAIPPRPKHWPVMMTWPNQRDMDTLCRADVTTEQRRKYFDEQLLREEKMMKRADQIHDWIMTHGGKLDSDRKKYLENLKLEPHNGIRWATLLDAKHSAHASTATVMRWGHTQVETLDGGRLRATDNGVKVKMATKQAIDLAIREGIARGWSTFEFKGNRKFVELAIQACREQNVEATITLNPALVPGIPGIGFRRKIKIMPNIPGFEEVHPGTEAATRQDGTPENDGAKMQKSLKERMSAAPKDRKPVNAAEAEADDVLEDLEDALPRPVPDTGQDVAFG